jgi:two-component system, LytTR family, sensor kinase
MGKSLTGYHRRILRHILFWTLLYAAVLVLQAMAPDSNSTGWFVQTTGSFAVVITILYINTWLCSKFFFNRRGLYFTCISLLYICYLLLVYLSSKDHVQINPMTGRASSDFAIGFFFTLYFLVLVLLSFLYWAMKIANKKNKELLATQQQLREFENDKNEAEKKALHSQINPHFLYNTLNYFYSRSLAISPELADSILLLSDIMRYSLELKENKHGMVLLHNEIEHIRNIIRINQYRFSNKLQVQYLLAGNPDKVCIAPLVLITFVENAFKHAELLDTHHPLLIKLDISENTRQIYFVVSNKKKKGPKEHGTGIGIDNARRRLSFIYSKDYELVIKDEPDFYHASLTLPLYKDNILERSH